MSFLLTLVALLAASAAFDIEQPMTLKQAACLDISLYTCELDPKYFDYTVAQLEQWIDTLANADQIALDIQVLRQVAALVENAKFSINQIDKASFLQIHDHLELLNKLHLNWAKCQVDDILDTVKQFQTQTVNSSRAQLAQTILDKIYFMIATMNDYLQQVNQASVTPSDLQNKIDQLQKVKQECQ